jgi:Tat protein translocase TatB subunit
VFNLSGSEVVVLLLLALIVLGPERLPDAIRSFGRIYGQVRRMGEGFQAEMRSALDEPMRELRETAELARRAVTEVPELEDPAAPADGSVGPNAGSPDPQEPKIDSTGDDRA